MTHRITILPRDAAAGAVVADALNRGRKLLGDMRTERTRNGDHTQRYRDLEHAYTVAATEAVEEMIDGAVILDNEPDPRVVAHDALIAYVRGLERKLCSEAMGAPANRDRIVTWRAAHLPPALIARLEGEPPA